MNKRTINIPLGIEKNVPMKDLTTFKIGGEAGYFYTAKDVRGLKEAVLWVKEKKLPFFVLGNGSNLLVSDKGFKGLVIKIEAKNVTLKNNLISAEAGALLIQLVTLALENSLTGFEWMAGIPGSVGGSINGNAGAFGDYMADSVKSVKALNVSNMEIKTIGRSECGFGHKKSIFKENKNLIILSAEFALKKGDTREIKEKMTDHLIFRRIRHPKEPSAGSIFKNIEAENLKPDFFKKVPEAGSIMKNNILPAGFFIEKSGLKGRESGGAKVSEKHSNFIVNFDNAKAKDIVKLIGLIKKEVNKKFGIKLEEEIQYLGFLSY